MDSQMCVCARKLGALLPGLGCTTDVPGLGPGGREAEGGFQEHPPTCRHLFLPTRKPQPHAQPSSGTVMGPGPDPALAAWAQSPLVGTAKAGTPHFLKGTESPAHMFPGGLVSKAGSGLQEPPLRCPRERLSREWQ